MPDIVHVSRITILWMIGITGLLVGIGRKEDNTSFYNVGPHKGLLVMSIVIDTYTKYILLILFSCVNCIIRSINHNYISPWIIHNVQEESTPIELPRIYIYEIGVYYTLYSWFDWLIYMNMLLAQIDMFLIESTTDIIISAWITKHYLDKKELHQEHTLLLS